MSTSTCSCPTTAVTWWPGCTGTAGCSARSTRTTGLGRPPWWLVVGAVLVGGLVTADLLTHGVLERMDLRVSEVVSDWGLSDSAAYPFVWLLTQIGGRVALIAVLAVLVGYLAWTRRT